MSAWCGLLKWNFTSLLFASTSNIKFHVEQWVLRKKRYLKLNRIHKHHLHFTNISRMPLFLVSLHSARFFSLHSTTASDKRAVSMACIEGMKCTRNGNLFHAIHENCRADPWNEVDRKRKMMRNAKNESEYDGNEIIARLNLNGIDDYWNLFSFAQPSVKKTMLTDSESSFNYADNVHLVIILWIWTGTGTWVSSAVLKRIFKKFCNSWMLSVSQWKNSIHKKNHENHKRIFHNLNQPVMKEITYKSHHNSLKESINLKVNKLTSYCCLFQAEKQTFSN